MTANVWLRQIATDVTPSEREIAHAIHRIESAARLLDRSYYGVLDCEASGSCAKETAILPVDDLDLMVYLDPNAWLSQRGERYPARGTLKALEMLDEAIQAGQTRTAQKLLKDAMGRG